MCVWSRFKTVTTGEKVASDQGDRSITVTAKEAVRHEGVGSASEYVDDLVPCLVENNGARGYPGSWMALRAKLFRFGVGLLMLYFFGTRRAKIWDTCIVRALFIRMSNPTTPCWMLRSSARERAALMRPICFVAK